MTISEKYSVENFSATMERQKRISRLHAAQAFLRAAIEPVEKELGFEEALEIANVLCAVQRALMEFA